MQNAGPGGRDGWDELLDAHQKRNYVAVIHAMQALTIQGPLLSLNTKHATLLLQAMQQCADHGDDLLLGLALQHGLPLLARWATQHSRRRTRLEEEHVLLQHAVAWLLALLDGPGFHSLLAPAASAAVLFLGAAYSGCGHDLQAAVAHAACALLSPRPRKQPLLESRDAQDACAGVRLMLEHAMQENPARCTWLLACLLASMQYANGESLARSAATPQPHPVPNPWHQSDASAPCAAHGVGCSSGGHGGGLGLQSAAVGCGGPVFDGGVLLPPCAGPPLLPACNAAAATCVACLVAASMRQLGAAAVQDLGAWQLSVGGGAGTRARGGQQGGGGGMHAQQAVGSMGVRGVGATPLVLPSALVAGAQLGGRWGKARDRGAGTPQAGGGRVAGQGQGQGRPAHARMACTVRSLESMAGLLAQGSVCLGSEGGSGEPHSAGPPAAATAATSLLAAAGLLEGLELQLLQMPPPAHAQIRASLSCALHQLVQPLQQAISAAAWARLLSRACQAGDGVQAREPPCSQHADSGHAAHAQPGSRCAGQPPLTHHALLAVHAWPELAGMAGVAMAHGMPPHAAAAAAATHLPTPAPSLLEAMGQGQLLPWTVGLVAGRLLAVPHLLQAVLPDNLPSGPPQTPHAPTSHTTQLPAPSSPPTLAAPPSPFPSQPPPAQAAAPAPPYTPPPLQPATAIILRHLLPRALLPALAARTLLECCLGLDALALCVVEARPPGAANTWLQGLGGGTDPLYKDAPSLARCIVSAASAPPLPPPPPLAPSPSQPSWPDARMQPPGAAPQRAGVAAPQAAGSADWLPGWHGAADGQVAVAAGQLEGVAAWDEARALCHGVAREALLDALLQGAAHASERYATVVLHAPACWLENLDRAALRDCMDRLYVSAVAPLPALLSAWPAWPVGGPHLSRTIPGGMDDRTPGLPTLQQQQQAHSPQLPAGPCCRSQAAARMLLLLGRLQFCRVQLPTLADLIQRLVWEAVQQPRGCEALLHGLPTYQQLTRPVTLINGASPAAPQPPQHESAVQEAGTPLASLLSPPAAPYGSGAHSSEQGAVAAGMADAVTAASMAFLLPLATACVSRTSSPHQAAERLLPSLYLLLKHPQPPVSEAAHASFGWVIQQLGDHARAAPCAQRARQQQGHEARPWWQAARGLGHVLGGRAEALGAEPYPPAALPTAERAACMRMAQQALPYYVQRSLQLPWEAAHVAGFERCLPKALSAMPPGSPITQYCLVYVLEAASSWLHVHPQHALDFSPLYGGSAGPQQQQQQQQQALHPGTHMVSMACNLILLADWQLLPQVLEGVANLVCRASPFLPPPPAAEPATHQAAPRAPTSTATVPPAPPPPSTAPSAAAAAAAAAALSPPDPPPGAPTSQQSALLQYLHDQLLRSDDYTRKSLLARWLLGLVGELRARAGGAAGGLKSTGGGLSHQGRRGSKANSEAASHNLPSPGCAGLAVPEEGIPAGFA